MPRLTADQWAQARADYEVRGENLTEIGRTYGVSQRAVAQQAKKFGWVRGKTSGLVERKVSAIKQLAQVNQETSVLPPKHSLTVDEVVRERLQADGIRAQFDVALASKGIEMLRMVSTPEDLEMLSRVSRNIRPQQPQTNVTVTQQQAQAQTRKTAAEVVEELIAAQEEAGA